MHKLHLEMFNTHKPAQTVTYAAQIAFIAPAIDGEGYLDDIFLTVAIPKSKLDRGYRQASSLASGSSTRPIGLINNNVQHPLTCRPVHRGGSCLPHGTSVVDAMHSPDS
jgi:hypothetical protein